MKIFDFYISKSEDFDNHQKPYVFEKLNFGKKEEKI